MAADFAANSIRGSVDGVRLYDPDELTRTYIPSPFSIGVDGVISGNKFAGNAQLTSPATGVPTAALTQSGTMQGGFFGPKATEVAGALAVKATGGGATMFVNGSFGAKKQ